MASQRFAGADRRDLVTEHVADRAQFGVGIRGKTVDSDRNRYAELLQVADMAAEVLAT